MACSDIKEFSQTLSKCVYNGKTLQLSLNYEDHYRPGQTPQDLVLALDKFKDVEHIRIISERDYEEPRSKKDVEEESREAGFLAKFEREISCKLRNLKSIYVETFASPSVFFLNWKHPSEHASIETVTVVNRIKRDHEETVNIRMKMVDGKRSVDFYGNNLDRLIWLSMAHLRISNLNNLEVVEVKTCLPRLYPTSLTPPESLKVLNIPGFSLSGAEFQVICTKCPKLEELVVILRQTLFLDEFSKVRNLVNLNFLVVSMDYDFSRQELIEVFSKSSFSALYVEIIECVIKGLLDSVSLKNGLINIGFSKGR